MPATPDDRCADRQNKEWVEEEESALTQRRGGDKREDLQGLTERPADGDGDKSIRSTSADSPEQGSAGKRDEDDLVAEKTDDVEHRDARDQPYRHGHCRDERDRTEGARRHQRCAIPPR